MRLGSLGMIGLDRNLEAFILGSGMEIYVKESPREVT